MRIFHKALSLVKEDGVPALFAKICNKLAYDIKNITLSLYYAVRMKILPPVGDARSLAAFVFTGCGGFIKPAQIQSEIAEFISLLYERKPKTLLEIGTASGGTLFLLSRSASENATVISIDMLYGKFGGGYYAWKIPLYRSFAMPRQRLHLIRDDSHNAGTVKKIGGILKGTKIDLLFIDGDHAYEGVKKDFELYAPFVSKGGIIAFHDIVIHPRETGCEVHRFWEEVKKGCRYQEIIADRGQIGCGIGVLYVD